MKKICLFFAIAAFAAIGVSAQEDLQPSIGVFASVAPWGEHYENSSQTRDGTTAYAGIGAYIDFIYGAISVGYQTQLVDFKQVTTGASPGTLITANENFSFLVFRAVGKLPIPLGDRICLFPMLGLEYDLLISSNNWDLLSETFKSDSNELYLVLGVGADISLGSFAYLRIAADYGINLTATPTVTTAGTTYSGYKINANVGVGFKF